MAPPQARPSLADRHEASSPAPAGLIASMPVTTTLCATCRSLLLANSAGRPVLDKTFHGHNRGHSVPAKSGAHSLLRLGKRADLQNLESCRLIDFHPVDERHFGRVFFGTEAPLSPVRFEESRGHSLLIPDALIRYRIPL